MAQKIIDFHTHIYPSKVAQKAVSAIGKFYGIPMEGVGTASALVKSGSKINAVKYVVFSAATSPNQVVSINNFIAEKCKKYEGLFVGYGTLHPYMDNFHEEIKRICSLGLKGLKFHPDFQEFDIDDPRAIDIYKVASELNLPIIFHMGDKTKKFSEPLKLRRVIDKIPDLKAIAAHFGGYSAWESSKKYLVGQNVFMDTSSSLFILPPEEAIEIIYMHGYDKIFFGTDFPMWDHEEELARFLKLPLKENEKSAILYDNAAHFLKL
ncbi:MAG: amidohydrolase family protein [Eubacteriales bacterium]